MDRYKLIGKKKEENKMIGNEIVVIEVKNDFWKGGELEVESGDEIIKIVKRMIGERENVVVKKDWNKEKN